VPFTLAEQLQKISRLSQVQQGELVQLWRRYKAEQSALAAAAEDPWVVAFVTERYGLKPKQSAVEAPLSQQETRPGDELEEDAWVEQFVTERYGLKPKSQAPAEVHLPQSCYTTEDEAAEDAWVERFVTERYGFGQPSNHPGRSHLQRF